MICARWRGQALRIKSYGLKKQLTKQIMQLTLSLTLSLLLTVTLCRRGECFDTAYWREDKRSSGCHRKRDKCLMEK